MGIDFTGAAVVVPPSPQKGVKIMKLYVEDLTIKNLERCKLTVEGNFVNGQPDSIDKKIVVKYTADSVVTEPGPADVPVDKSAIGAYRGRIVGWEIVTPTGTVYTGEGKLYLRDLPDGGLIVIE